jgi:hypothetical protein
MEAIPQKDIAIAVIGGAASIAAILLVFVGFLLGKAEALPENTPDDVIARYRRTAKLGIVPLLACVLVLLDAYAWLYYSDSAALLHVWNWGFPVATVVFTIYSIWAIVIM